MKLRLYACLLITSCLQPIAEKYSYNYGLFPNLLKEEIVKLPADVNGEPDYEYMEKYMSATRVVRIVPETVTGKSYAAPEKESHGCGGHR